VHWASGRSSDGLGWCVCPRERNNQTLAIPSVGGKSV
jgi:hypothetical protein